MAKVIVPKYVATIGGGEPFETSPGVRAHYLKSVGGDESKLKAIHDIKFEQVGFVEIDANDSVAIATATLGGDPDDRR